MKFTKMHGAGNDFVVVDARGIDRAWAEIARAACNRHFGIGADGLLLVLHSETAELRMRMFNPDGSEAEMCGNGIRCFAKFALERDIVPWPEQALRIETGSGLLSVEPVTEAGRMVRARVGMGVPRLRPQEVPVDPSRRPGAGAASPTDERVLDWPLTAAGYEFHVTGVSMGNPHAVAFVDAPVQELPLDRIGPEVEHHALFPQRVNFEVVNVEDRGHLRARVWERGAGLTQACGSGASAIAVAARLHGYTDDHVDITLPGGVLKVSWDGVGEVVMEGPVQEVFAGEWEPQEE